MNRVAALLALLCIATSAQAQENTLAIKSRVLGEKLRVTQQACRQNLMTYCAGKGNQMAAEVSFSVAKKDTQYDVVCSAICKPGN